MHSSSVTQGSLKVRCASPVQDLRKVMSAHSGRQLRDLSFISIDAGGADIRVRNGAEVSVERIGFDARVQSVEEAVAAVRRVIESCNDDEA